MRPQFYIDSFKDNEGKEHPFVICAVVKEVHVNDYVFSLVKISYFSNDKIMTAYSGKYFDVINCKNINEYYIVSKDYEYDEMFCKNY